VVVAVEGHHIEEEAGVGVLGGTPEEAGVGVLAGTPEGVITVQIPLAVQR
jgi:hypothetical protein